MANNNCVGGIIRVTVDGTEIRAKGDFTWNLGKPLREAVMGAGYTHGFKKTPQVSFIEGALTDRNDTDVAALADIESATIILELPNGKSIVWREAYWAVVTEGTTQEGEVKLKFESPYPAEVIQ